MKSETNNHLRSFSYQLSSFSNDGVLADAESLGFGSVNGGVPEFRVEFRGGTAGRATFEIESVAKVLLLEVLPGRSDTGRGVS